MLKIRLSRVGKHKRPFYRVILTEHIKAAKTAWKEILGRYDPIHKTQEINVDAIKSWIEKGAKPSERVAKIVYNQTKDSLFQKYFFVKDIKKTKKNPDKHEN